MLRTLAMMFVIAFVSTPSAAFAQTTCAAYDPDQGWTREQREQFWFMTQGSRLLPHSWFIALEDLAPKTTLFKDGLDRFGFIPTAASPANHDALPVGFTRDRPGTDAFVGLTCAACHTSRLRLRTTWVVVEGAPTLADFELFMKELQVVLEANAESPKFARFAQRVLGQSPSQTEIDLLRRQLQEAGEYLRGRWNAHWPSSPSGPGRVDAFGQIFNQVAAYAIDAPQNARVADAPVSYPFLWNTPQHNVVQWNGSASNRLPFELGELFRNLGEALGVFGNVDVQPKIIPSYRSSIDIPNLKALEKMLKTLRPPAWPVQCAPVNEVLVREGKKIYGRNCASCHKVLARTDLKTRFKARLEKVSDIGTDDRMLKNFDERFLTRSIATGKLKPTLKAVATGSDILTNVILGTLIGGGTHAGDLALESDVESAAEASSAMRKFRNHLNDSKRVYKARPLTGIWATGPYLHNGSVPTLAELLKPPDARRPTFYVGDPEFDFTEVGISTNLASGAVLFDTTKPGNSNRGHTAGTMLSQDQKEALLEYLKVIGER